MDGSKNTAKSPANDASPAASGTSRALSALASGALALPGLATPASADSPVQDTSLNYAFSFYREDNLAVSKFANTGTGSRERYEILAHQFNLLTPLTSRIDASVDMVFETMSGASPWWVEPNPTSNPVELQEQAFLQVMSGATIFEERFDGQITVNHYFDRGKATLSGGASSEKDYLSGNLAFAAERNYNDKNTTHSVAIGYSWDTITPTDAANFNRLPEYSKNSLTIDTTLSQILSPSTILQLGLAYKRSSGFLSDPYKKYVVATLSGTLEDARPELRNQLTFSGRLRQYIAPAQGALHIDVAGHWDDWEVNGFSGELAWFQTVWDGVSIVPSFRYYSQSQAFFYGPVFIFGTRSDGLGTSDYRLSPYGALSYGLRAEADITDWPDRGMLLFVNAGYQRYISRGDYALQSVENENPGLVKYHLFSLQVGGRF